MNEPAGVTDIGSEILDTASVLAGRDFNGAGEVLLVDKPETWSSFDVVKKVRNLLRARKVGHCGTLDPNASGLLLLCTGAKTKSIEELTGLDKEYVGTLRLGVRTPSFDLETEISEWRSLEGVTEHSVREVMASFVGVQAQMPPMFSAVKVNGKPLYKIARKGRSVERPERTIEIKELDVTAMALPEVSFRVVCSKGTYIRVLAEDIGLKLGCGAVLTALRRTRIGPYGVERALTIERLITEIQKPGVERSPQL